MERLAFINKISLRQLCDKIFYIFYPIVAKVNLGCLYEFNLVYLYLIIYFDRYCTFFSVHTDEHDIKLKRRMVE